MRRLFTLMAVCLLCAAWATAADEVYNVRVRITWNDQDNAEGYRPASVSLLFGQVNGQTVTPMPAMSCTLTADGNWEYLLQDVSPATYRITEAAEGYQLRNDTYVFTSIAPPTGLPQTVLRAVVRDAEPTIDDDELDDGDNDDEEEEEEYGPITLLMSLVMERDGTIPSGIEATLAPTDAAMPCHTLSGQRVTRPTLPGVYVVKGKKVVVK